MPRVGSRSTDWRHLDNREELFFRYLRWRLSVHDLDHSHYCKVLTEGMTDSEKCWFSFLFGMTYRTPQAYAYWYTFPNVEEIDLEAMEEWHKDNWKRTSYGTDTRYNKGHFVAQTESILEWKAGGTLLEKVLEAANVGTAFENFSSLFEEICTLHKYGRMTAWITCQCLYDTLRLPIDFDNVLVRNPSTDSSMMSIWNGYQVLKGREDRLLGKYAEEGNYKVTKTDLEEVSKDIMRYREKAVDYVGSTIDIFKWESIWCQFKRLFNKEYSWEYPGHSSGDATSRYLYYREHWPEVDWTPFRRALLSQESIIKGQTYVGEYNKIFGRTGLLLNLHEMYPDMVDAHEALGLDRADTLVKELFLDHGLFLPNYKGGRCV